METQTTILNLVTSAKNQEKPKEELQKLNVSQQQQKILKVNAYNDIFHVNTTKTLYVGNLNKNISEEDLYELFGLWNTIYLK